MYSYLSTSRGDGNLVPQTRGSPICLSIDTYLPREGPETFYQMYLCHQCCSYSYLSASRGDGNNSHKGSTSKKIFGISTYLPREGTETLLLIDLTYPYNAYSYLSTSRGAGKFFSYKYGIFLKNYISSRGAGNFL